jgi:hypothetical protein
MKQLNQQIKLGMLCLILCLSLSTYAQKDTKSKNSFVRVYNLEGKKVNKGHVIFVNDSILSLKDGYASAEIKIETIGKIKTKRSAGHNVLVGTTAGAGIGAILGVSTADPDAWIMSYTAGEGAMAMGSLGAIGGAALGGIVSAFKNSETYIIDGELKKWIIFKEMVEKK